MDPLNYLQNLSVPELEVEYIVRGLTSKAVDAYQILINSLTAERSDKSLLPKVSHANQKPSKEIELCVSKYNELSSATVKEGPNPSLDFLTIAYAKTLHYQARTERLINLLGESPESQALRSNWRRAVKWCAKLWEEQVEIPTKSKTLIVGEPSPENFLTSSFSEKIDSIVDNQFPQSKLNATSIDQNITLKTTAGSSQPQYNFPKLPELENSVHDFFSQIVTQPRPVVAVKKPENNNNKFIPQVRANGPNQNKFAGQMYQNHSLNEDENMSQCLDYQPQNQQARQGNYYKLRQRWNLSFDGSDSMNVHDFMYRLETMARDDGIMQRDLPKIMHLFLSKSADDWYWVYKSSNPNSTWAAMKSAMLSFFSSYDFEEETKEQLLRRYQNHKEKFSDFALAIQKLNTRLQHRLTDHQIIYRLCQNMNPALKNVTLPYQNNITTVEELRSLCQRYERMWDQTGYDPRRFNDQSIRRRPNISEIQDTTSSGLKHLTPRDVKQTLAECSPEPVPKLSVEAINRNYPNQRNSSNGEAISVVPAF